MHVLTQPLSWLLFGAVVIGAYLSPPTMYAKVAIGFVMYWFGLYLLHGFMPRLARFLGTSTLILMLELTKAILSLGSNRR